MYNIYSDGLDGIRRSLLFNKQKFARQGLSGTPDGSNKTFFTVMSPLLSEETTEIREGGSLISSASYTLDLETGMVEFDSAPSVQPVADYYQVQFSEDQLKGMLWDGFAIMESYWRRGYRLSSASNVYTAADQSSASVFIMDGSSAIDPVVGSATFGTSHIQARFYLVCVELRLLQAQENYWAPEEMSFRNDRGMSADLRGRAKNTLAAMEAHEAAIRLAMRGAQEESHGTFYPGEYISPPKTADYEENYEWEDAS